MSWHKEHFENLEDYLENKKYKYTVTIFNYKNSGPDLFVYDSDFIRVFSYPIGFYDKIFNHWVKNTWFFKEEKYGFHEFGTDDLYEFSEHLNNY